jgi:hypothetical protein
LPTQTGPIMVGPTAAERVIVWGGFPVAGGGGGAGLAALAGWIVSLPWFPYQGPFRLVDSLADAQAMIGGGALGVLAGLTLAFLAERDYVKVTVDEDEVTVVKADVPRTLRRDEIQAVFLDGKQLVLLGTAGEELVRESGDLDAKRLPEAFRARGYPWHDGDPYRDEYRRWVEDLPDLPDTANVILKARQKALDSGDKADAAQLRQELARLGIVVTDDGKRQFWRRIDQA